jgi:hypothetical protein
VTRFEAFLDDLDDRWTYALPDRLPFRVIGSTALFLQTDYERGTKDGDVLRAERDGFDDAVCSELERLAGRNADVFDRHGMYLDLVRGSLPYLPVDPVWHRYPALWKHFDVTVLDVADVCVSKLKRWVGSDREDVSQMIQRSALEHPRFVERFRSMIERNGFDGRADELLPLMVDRLHEVERDLFALDQVTLVELPPWITE